MDIYLPQTMVVFLSMFSQHFPANHHNYFRGYIWALMILGKGRKCMTKVADACFFVNRHLASWERFLSEYKWDLDGVRQTMVKLLVTKLKDRLMIHGAYLLALDTTLVAKVLGKMDGVQKWHNSSGNPGQGEYAIGHHWGIIGLISTYGVGFLCWPLLARLIFGHNAVAFIAGLNGITTMTFWDVTIALVTHARLLLGDVPIRVVVDAYFGKAPFIQPMLDMSIHVITRLRSDAVGWEDPVYCGCGRPPKYGKKRKLAHLLNLLPRETVRVQIYGKWKTMQVVSCVLWIRDVSQKVKIVVIATKGIPIILISTDLTLTAKQIIRIYSARFSLELTIRDLKQHFGLGDYQCTTSSAIYRFVALSLKAFCLWRLTLLEDQNADWITSVPSDVHSATTDLSFTRICKGLKRLAIKKIFVNSAPDADFEKLSDTFEQIFRIAA
jgi:hypothetical protein